MPEVLILTGSPRVGGNTDTLVSSFVSGLESKKITWERVNVAQKDISPCTSCDGCNETGECVIDDDMQELYKKIDNSKAVVLASPIFFGNVSAQMKTFIDRLQKYWFVNFGNKHLVSKKIRKKRIGFFICVGGMKNKKYCEGAKITVDVAFLNLNIKGTDCLCLREYDEKGSIDEDPQALKKAYDKGVAFANEVNKIN